MTKPLTQEQLDRAVCSTPNCGHREHESLAFHARCHPKGGLEVRYQKDDGTMTVACLECSRPVVVVLVAREPAI